VTLGGSTVLRGGGLVVHLQSTANRVRERTGVRGQGRTETGSRDEKRQGAGTKRKGARMRAEVEDVNYAPQEPRIGIKIKNRVFFS